MTEGRALTRLVILDGEVWPAGSVPPATVAERIRNPRCWEDVESEPELPWGPEGMPSVGTATSPVVPADPASSIPNLDEKAGDSAVTAAQPGLPIARDPAEASGSAFARKQQPDSAGSAEEPTEEPELHDRIAVEDDEPQQEPEQELMSEPRRSGPGSSESAWRQFAASRGVQVSDDDDRAAIIAACRDAGVVQ